MHIGLCMWVILNSMAWKQLKLTIHRWYPTSDVLMQSRENMQGLCSKDIEIVFSNKL